MPEMFLVSLFKKRRCALIGLFCAILINIATIYSAGVDKTVFEYVYSPIALSIEILARLAHSEGWRFVLSLWWVGLLVEFVGIGIVLDYHIRKKYLISLILGVLCSHYICLKIWERFF